MKRHLFLYLLAIASCGVNADWQLNSRDSAVNFISTKKTSTSEVHHFKSLSGSIENNKASVLIDLSSVETNIPIRNERMQSLLFETKSFLLASISAEIDTAKLLNMKCGDSESMRLVLGLDFHGISKQIESEVHIVKLTNDSVQVYSQHPIIIKAEDFGLAKGVEALRNIANLPVISTAVPVTFNLKFEKLNN